jgi:hypothetical protein
MESVAISVDEKDGMVLQLDLLKDKALQQILGLFALNFSVKNLQDEVFLPPNVVEVMTKGGVLAAMSADTAVSQRVLTEKEVWTRRPNLYIPEKILKSGKQDSGKVKDYILREWEERFAGLREGVSAVRRVASSIAITTAKFEPNAAVSKTIQAMPTTKPTQIIVYPAAQYSGIATKTHPLTTERERIRYLDYVAETAKSENNWEAFQAWTDLSGRPDGLKIEQYVSYAEAIGIVEAILVDAPKTGTVSDELMRQGENGCYELFASLLLAIQAKYKLGDAPDGFVIERYPKHRRAKELLS